MSVNKIVFMSLLFSCLFAFSYITKSHQKWLSIYEGKEIATQYLEAFWLPTTEHDDNDDNNNNAIQIQEQQQQRPPLHTLINGTKEEDIIGNVTWLLDFAIIGFGKCGTSTMMVWLKNHPEIQSFGREMTELMRRRPGLLIQRLYNELRPGTQYQRGYKAPQDISQDHILNYYRNIWPKTKLIIGIRHPIYWFESLYNFRIQNLNRGDTMPHPNNLIKHACGRDTKNTCTAKGDYIFYLFKLGIQNYPKPRLIPNNIEQNVLNRYPRAKVNITEYPYMSNPIFIFDLQQLQDNNETRIEQFRIDMTKFMKLKQTLPSIPHYKPGKKQTNDEQIKRDKMKINICDDEYKIVRDTLMTYARSASVWIIETFIKAPNVHVSSPEYFHYIMNTLWLYDPCENKNNITNNR